MSTKGITIASVLLCLGGVASYLKGNEITKPLALNITFCAATVAATNHLSSKWVETLNRERSTTIETRLREKIESLEKTNKHYLTALSEVKQLCDRTTTELAEKTATVQAFEQQIGVIKREYHRKTEELNAKMQQEDTRFADCLGKFKTAIIEDLRARIDKVYNELDRSVEHKLNATDEDGVYEYQKIFLPLQKFRSVLEAKFVDHCEILKDYTFAVFALRAISNNTQNFVSGTQGLLENKI